MQISSTVYKQKMVQNRSKQMSVDFDTRGQQEIDFLLGGSNITDLFKEKGFWTKLINTYFFKWANHVFHHKSHPTLFPSEYLKKKITEISSHYWTFWMRFHFVFKNVALQIDLKQFCS